MPVGSATSLDLNLFDDAQFIAQLDRVEDLGPGRFSWIGALVGVPAGRVTLAIADGVLAGSVTTPAAAYAVRWQPGDVYDIQQVNTGASKREAEPIRLDAAQLAAQDGEPTARRDDGSLVDLLVVYTPAARAGAGSTSAIAALIALGVSETNQAYAAVGLTSRLRLVGTAEWSRTEGGSANSQLSALRSATDVAALRNSLGADLVMGIENNLTDACGIGYLMTTLSTSSATGGYSLVERSCVSPNYSFAHELGHNMGSDHAPEDGGTGGVYSYAVGYKDTVSSFRTIMAYDCTPSCGRLLTFSSPSFSFNGRATGRSTQDNARSLTNTVTTVANFRTAVTTSTTAPGAPSILTASTSGSSVALQWSAPSTGSAPTAYSIEAGSGAGLANLANFSTGTTSTSYSASGVVAGVYYVRLRANNSAGTSTASNEVVLTVGGPCSAAPAAPGGLRLVSTAGGTVALAWTAPSGVPTTYIAEAGSATGLSNLANVDLGGTATTLTATGVARGTYYLRVRARNACGTGAASNELTVVVP